MKKGLLLCTALFSVTCLFAQNPTAYFMEGTTQRSQYNAAFAPLRGYINLPALGNINASTSGNLSLDKLLFPHHGELVTLLDSSVSADEALSGLHPDNLLGLNTQVNLLGFGLFASDNRSFWSFEINARVDAESDIPYSLFEFLKKGNDTHINGIGMQADSYLEAALCCSFPLAQDRLYLGIRGKVLFGAARARLGYDRFDISMKENEWVIDAHGQLDVTADGTTADTYKNDDGETVFKPADLHFSPSKPAGYGFAVDVGATYDLTPNLQASLAANDLGVIRWNKSGNITGNSVKQLRFSGVEVSQDGTSSQPDFDMDVLEFTPKASASQTKWLRATVNAGLEYEVWRHKIGFGALYSVRFNPYKTQHEVTGSVNFHPIRWFTLSTSYSCINNHAHAIGLAMNLCPSWINFFIATNVLTVRHTPQWLPIEQSRMHVTLGLAVPIGRRSHRIDTYINRRDKR